MNQRWTWSGAVAPAAAISLVTAPSTSTTDGIDLAAQYIVNHRTAAIVSVSYGSCEQDMGVAELAFYNGLWEQAASQGMSVFVASGDAGAAGCSTATATRGAQAAVNGLCSSPYSTCIGGTEFNEGSQPSQYWSSANTASYGSALGYIPEEVWNESGANGGTGLWASGGGASQVYAQPAWQAEVSGAGAANGMRAVPDVALSAANHDGYMVYENGSYWIVSGTSAASPSFAGVMALVAEEMGGSGLGSVNAELYSLVNAERNPFHSTPAGNNSVPGVAGFWANGAAYNLATGLGSVDGAVLAGSWKSGGGADFALSGSAAGGTVPAGKTVTFTIGVTEIGAGKSAVALSANAPAGVSVSFSPSTIQAGTQATAIVSAYSTAMIGTQNISVVGSDASGTETLTYALTVTEPPTLTLTAASNQIAVDEGGSVTVSLTAVTGGPFAGSIDFSTSGLPSGLAAAWSANSITPASSVSTNTVTLRLTPTPWATQGTFSFSIAAAGDGLVSAQSITVQVQKPMVCFGLLLPLRSPCNVTAPARLLIPHLQP